MQDQTLTLAVQYLRLVGDLLHHSGVSVDHWLGLSQLSREDLEDTSLSLTFPQFKRLIVDGARLAEEPAVGFVLGARLVPSTHGALGYAVMNSGTLREVIELTQRYMSVRAGFLSLTHEESADGVRVIISELFPLGEIRTLVLEAVVLSVKKALDAVSMGSCPALSASFPFPTPDYGALASELMGCEVRFQQPWAGFTLAPHTLDVPLKMADPAAFKLAEQLCQRELEGLAANRSFSARVRRLLLEHRHGFPTLPTTARLLQMTPRTLHRRLKAEGTSYRDILDELRHRMAIDHLKAGRSSVEEIAYMLGYADSANFRRAFKRWTGRPPSSHRA